MKSYHSITRYTQIVVVIYMILISHSAPYLGLDYSPKGHTYHTSPTLKAMANKVSQNLPSTSLDKTAISAREVTSFLPRRVEEELTASGVCLSS